MLSLFDPLCYCTFQGVLDRFQQISPKVIISVDAVRYNSKTHIHLDKLRQVVDGLPDLHHVIVVPFVNKDLKSTDISSVSKRYLP